MRRRVSAEIVNGQGRDRGYKAGSGSHPRNHADFIWSVADLLRVNACHRLLEREKEVIERQDTSVEGINVGINDG